jgi:protein phosphatase
MPRLGVQAVLRTDVGLVRSENQDFGTYTTPREESHSHPGGRLLVVADGMGGHRGGATASRLAGETVKAQYLGSETYDIAQALRESLTRANARIFSEAQANPDLRGMGTTTSALVVKNNQAWFAHVGDSRIYLVRGGEIRQITEDHSLVASMVREGLLTPKEAETHPRRNVLQRSMGVGEDVDIDVSGPFPIQENDVFVLCSDGLHGLVKEPELKDIAALPIDEAATEYVRLALSRGAPDNVTVIVAKVIPIADSGNETPDDADETLADHPLDETQRDTAPIPAVRDEPIAAAAPVEAAPPPPVAHEPETGEQTLETPMQPERLEKTIETPIAAEPAAGSFVKWALIVILVLGGAAGAWFYWNHQHGVASTTSSPTR